MLKAGFPQRFARSAPAAPLLPAPAMSAFIVHRLTGNDKGIRYISRVNPVLETSY